MTTVSTFVMLMASFDPDLAARTVPELALVVVEKRGSSDLCVLLLCCRAFGKRLSHQGYRRGSKKGPQHRVAGPPAVRPPTSALGSHACVAPSSGRATR